MKKINKKNKSYYDRCIILSHVDQTLELYIKVVYENLQCITKKNSAIRIRFKNYKKKLLYYHKIILRRYSKAVMAIRRSGKDEGDFFQLRYMSSALQKDKKINILFLRIMVDYIYQFHRIYKKKKKYN